MEPQSIPSVSQDELAKRRTARSADTMRLVGLCSAFLHDSIPSTNVILAAHFARYLPLFNEKAVEEMGEDRAKALATEYRGRFSLHHPIKIISPETTDDPNIEAAIYPEDGKRHVVVQMLPPVFKQIKTLNEIYIEDENGNKIHQSMIPQLIDGLFNTSLRNDPVSKGKYAEYVANVAQAIHIANPEAEKDKIIESFNAEQGRVAKQVMDRVAAEGGESHEAPATPSSIKTQEDDNPMTGLIDW